MDGHARAAVADQRAPAGVTPAEVVKDIESQLIPGAILVPAMVGEITRMMQRGYTLVPVVAFRP